MMNLGRYRAIAQLGAGTDGVCFSGDIESTRERVEIRVLAAAKARPDRWGAVEKRLKTLALLEDPVGVRLIDFAPEGDRPYAVLEWAEAPTLADRHDGRAWDRSQAVSLVRELACGMAAAHKLGIVHEAFSPSSVLLPDSMRPKVDWSHLDVGNTTLELNELTPACRSPEACMAGYVAEPPADVFALGVVFIWLVTGSLPWEQEFQIGEKSLDHLAKRMLALDPLERPSAREVAMALDVWKAMEVSGETADINAVARTDPSGIPLIPPRTTALPPISDEPIEHRQRLGRYKLAEKLGQGGMGAVYRAIDMADGREVAIKLLSPNYAARPESLKRFLKEARMLAEVNSPHVTNFLELNEDDGLHYLAIEFVRGVNAHEYVSQRGKLSESAALTIAAEVARALAIAHERMIVHRDVKPENILMLGNGAEDSAEAPRVKLSDFGLARHVIENDSLVMTQAGTILGTPLYMSPEQCMGGAIDARSDVYSLGATLFHLLAGRPPFLGPTPLAVIAMHRNEPPPELKSFNSQVSDGVAQLISKSLAKLPSQRYADAAAMLVDIERLLRGEPTGIAVHPKLPESDKKDLVEFDWRFDLEASPAKLWPHVSNTERLNKAVGIPAVEYKLESDGEGGLKRIGEFRKMGMNVAWREHPFEWIEGRRFGVVREYPEGPFRWFVSIVELEPKANGGTTLHHRVRISARGMLGRTIAAVEVGLRGKKTVTGVYHRIDMAVSGKLGNEGTTDPFEVATELPKEQQTRLDAWLDRMSQRGLDPIAVEQFGEFLAHAPSQEVARIRPLALARRLTVDPNAIVTMCLLGAKDGVLSLHWDLLCPICRIPSQVLDTLRAMREHGNCQACQSDYELDFANSVELIFRADASIRHTDLAVYCVGGPAHSPHVAAQTRVGPGERVEFDLELTEGQYRFRGPQLPFAVDFRVEPRATSDRWDLKLSRPPGDELPRSLRTGGQAFSVRNDLDREVVVRIERVAAREDALTAGRASTLALFRELFPSEMLEPGQLVNLATATFLVTQLDGAEQLYADLGDAKAFALIHEYFRAVDSIIRREGGALIKTVDEGIFAAFTDPVGAVQAALAIPPAIANLHDSAGKHLRLRVGVHRGSAMVATLNDHLDYFGTTVRIASTLPRYCEPGDVLLTAALANEPTVAAIVQARGLEGEIASLAVPGLERDYVVRYPLGELNGASQPNTNTITEVISGQAVLS